MKSLCLRNFRSFEDTGDVPLAPLTLLVGANSSGKSSFARFLPLLRQSLAESVDGPLLWFGESVDFGSYSQALRRGSATPMEVVVGLDGAGKGDVRVGLRIARDEGREYTDRLTVEAPEFSGTVSLSAGGGVDVEVQGCRRGGWSRAGGWKWQALIPTLVRGDGNELPGGLERALSILQRRTVSAAHLPLHKLNLFSRDLFGASDRPGLESAWTMLLMKRMGVSRPVNLSGLLDSELQLILEDVATQALLDYLHRARTAVEIAAFQLAYVGPARVATGRMKRSQNLRVDYLSDDGSNLPEFLASLDAERARSLSEWCRRATGMGVRAVREGAILRVLMSGSTGGEDDLVDLGFGLSQVLPILVQLWSVTQSWEADEAGREVSFVVMEQPELHLHPRLQSTLADALVATVTSSMLRDDVIRGPSGVAPQSHAQVNLLVETHSQTLVNRIGEQIARGLLSRDHCRVVLFDKPDLHGPTTVKVTGFDQNGILMDWPFGFFSP